MIHYTEQIGKYYSAAMGKNIPVLHKTRANALCIVSMGAFNNHFREVAMKKTSQFAKSFLALIISLTMLLSTGFIKAGASPAAANADDKKPHKPQFARG